MQVAKPFVKWAGGKGGLIKTLDDLLPSNFAEIENLTYIEPFVGGGAMLFHVLNEYKNIRRVVINDINPDLIHCYKLIYKDPENLIERLRNLENNFFNPDIKHRKEVYYAYRDQFNMEGIGTDERAALFMFLNHTCFNGLYRVNTQGKFNVPIGSYVHPTICNEEVIREDNKLFKSVEFVVLPAGDYKRIEKRLSTKNPNFIYFDPPYRPITKDSNNFNGYTASRFGDPEQEELKVFCDKMHQKGCKFMLSNSDSKNEKGESYFEGLYKEYLFSRVTAPRFINAYTKNRHKLYEVLIRNY